MRFIYWLVTALIALVVVVFAVSNREYVPLNLFPLPQDPVKAPLFLVVIVALVLGFIVGALVAWLGGGRRRAEARALRRRIDRLQRDLGDSLPAAAKISDEK